MKRIRPHLVCPGGGELDSVRAAADNGADAVYVGLKYRVLTDRLRNELSCRGEIACLFPNQVEAAYDYCSARGVELVIALNTVFDEHLRQEAVQALEFARGLGVKSVIASDIAFIKWVSQTYPELDIHVSILGGVANRLTAALYQELGARRIILENNLSLAALRELRASTDVELEIFMYGLTCLAFHGACHVSAFADGVPCRAPCNEPVTVFTPEGERHGHYLRARDLDLLKLIPTLADLGIDAFKIEGRMRSARYVGLITSAARQMLDSWAAGRECQFTRRQEKQLSSLPFFGATRGYFETGTPEETSIAVEGGSKFNKLREMVAHPKLAAYLVSSKMAEGKAARRNRGSGSAVVQPAINEHRPHEPCGLGEHQELILDTPLMNPVIVGGVDTIFVGEKFCVPAFMEKLPALESIIEQIEESGAAPAITVPGRVPDSEVEKLVGAVSKFQGRVRAVNCYDLGVARALSGDFDVTVSLVASGPTGSGAMSDAAGAVRLRPPGNSLMGLLKQGFPQVPVDIQVFGPIPVSGGVFCLSRYFGKCGSCESVWWKVVHERAELRLRGNALYSEKYVSAHLLQPWLRDLPVAGLVIETLGSDKRTLEQVVSFYRTGVGWPNLDEEKLCNGCFASDPEDLQGSPIGWKEYLHDWDEVLHRIQSLPSV